MSEPVIVFPPESMVCERHHAIDCALCFQPSDPMHFDEVDQQLADKDRELAEKDRRISTLEVQAKYLKRDMDSALRRWATGTKSGRAEEAEARADRAEAALKQARGGEDEEHRARVRADVALRKAVETFALVQFGSGDDYDQCYVCSERDKDGHRPDCAVGNALAAAREVLGG